MSRNIEIKARVKNFKEIQACVECVSDTQCQILVQQDTFFRCKIGRLKLRIFDNNYGELIHYNRPDIAAPKTSNYSIVNISNPADVLSLLSDAFEVIGVVTKTRLLYMVGKTRIHLDKVEGLGYFIELEVVLDPDDTEEMGQKTATQLMQQLNINKHDLIDHAYIDLLCMNIL